jgi:hypothetical protein
MVKSIHRAGRSLGLSDDSTPNTSVRSSARTRRSPDIQSLRVATMARPSTASATVNSRCTMRLLASPPSLGSCQKSAPLTPP